MPRDDKESPLAGRTIMVVEDEFLLALDVEAMLSKAGCAVVGPVASCRRALDILARTRPDAVLLDLNLGEETSEPVARVLREQSIPFIVATGYSRSFMRDPAFDGVAMLPKPVDEATLIALLARVLT
ncbi:response regulator [Alsobacter metallidurans]|uniref:Response regulator n=1 Tax=Alsobacter metallidurans TaxID=340221 RepID=A0A917I4U7_9HYPH|nr:response regulator [Alsobacter metallidurans]GGH12807.1 response regulator [Alsobacter metallidurans]